MSTQRYGSFAQVCHVPWKLTYINSDVAELWPAQRMIEVVFAKVVLGEVRYVCLLDVWYV